MSVEFLVRRYTRPIRTSSFSKNNFLHSPVLFMILVSGLLFSVVVSKIWFLSTISSIFHLPILITAVWILIFFMNIWGVTEAVWVCFGRFFKLTSCYRSWVNIVWVARVVAAHISHNTEEEYIFAYIFEYIFVYIFWYICLYCTHCTYIYKIYL